MSCYVTIGMYPMCVLNLVIPSTGVDVNVHPNKLEVRFRDEDMMRTVCETLLARAFEGERVLEIDKLAAPQRTVERRAEVREIPAAKAPEQMRLTDAARPAEPQKPADFTRPAEPPKPAHAANPAEPPKPMNAVRPAQQPGTAEAPKPFKPQMPPLPTTGGTRVLREDTCSVVRPDPVREVDAKPAEAPAPKPEIQPVPAPEPVRKAPDFRVIGVAFKTYILVESGETLLLIDQHAAHERLQYEKYMARAEAGAASQQLLTPLVLSVSGRELAVIEENRDALAAAGYEVEPFGEREIRVSAVPFVMGRAELKPLFLEMLQSLSQLKAATLDARRAEIMQMACKSAVKGGDPLTESEIASLIGEMLKTGAPPTCPHGRPVVKTMTRRDLEKLFKRIQ